MAVEADIAVWPDRAGGLTNEWYVDADHFRREMAGVFGSGWACAGVGAEIPEAGDVFPTTVAGQPVLLVRDKQGEIRAFHNVCRHRGILLMEAPARRQAAIRCPYHSWTYGLDGRLVRTPEVGGPGVGEADDIDRTALGLLPIRVETWLDFIFVNLSGEASALNDLIDPLVKRWAAYDLSLLKHGGTRSYDLAANWKLAIENYLESYHLPWIHPGLNSYSPLELHGYETISPRIFGPYSEAYKADTVDDRTLPHFPGLPEVVAPRGEYPLVFPNLLVGIQRDHLFGIIIEPRGHARTIERLHVYPVDDGTPETPERTQALDEIMTGWDAIFLEDIGIVERMQTGRSADAFDGGVLTQFHDRCTARFMDLVADSTPVTPPR